MNSTSTTSGFTVRTIHLEEIDQVASGLARNFALTESAHTWMREQWPIRIVQRPGFSLSNCRVGVLHGRVVAHAMVEPFILRYGGARLRVAGIGKVYTEEGYRGRGFGAAVVRDALAFAVQQGAHLALLHGIRSYYTQFGFSPVWPEYRVEFDSAEVAALDTPLDLRPAQPSDVPRLAALYERHWGGRVTFMRNLDIWAWRMIGGDDARRAFVTVGEDDEPQGYIAGRNLASSQVEVVADTPEAALTLLGRGGQWHQESGQDKVVWLMPPDDALSAFARQIVNVSVSAQFQPDGGWMARLVDAPTLVETLLPEIYEQARLSLPRLRITDVILVGEAQGVEVGMEGRSAITALLSQRDFIQVLFGSLSPAALGIRNNLPPEAVRMLQAYFPPRVAALGAWDWF